MTYWQHWNQFATGVRSTLIGINRADTCAQTLGFRRTRPIIETTIQRYAAITNLNGQFRELALNEASNTSKPRSAAKLHDFEPLNAPVDVTTFYSSSCTTMIHVEKTLNYICPLT